MGRTASDIIIDRFLKDVEEKESMPWQRPYEMYNSFNYFTKESYRGINRLILPFGEYLTKNQINNYNKQHNEDFRFQKGIRWYPVVFFTRDERKSSYDECSKIFPDIDVNQVDGWIGTDGLWNYYHVKTKGYVKARNILKYYEVAERQHFMNSKGEFLPSRLESGEVEITLSEPKKVIDDYVERSGVKMRLEKGVVPCYSSFLDRVVLNPITKNEDTWFSTAFHEFAHSTGHAFRLNREGITNPKSSFGTELYAKEECIAEITACLLCAECGVYDFETSCKGEYENNIAYVQSWKKRVKDWGREFIYIVSQADKAFNYILGTSDL